MSETLKLTADRQTYIRSHTWMAALGMAGAMLVLWLLGNPHVWTGAVAGLAAVAVRGWYLASEELNVVWTVENGVLTGPAERRIPLGDIALLRSFAGTVQVVTHAGDKHLIKYQADPQGTIASIERARR